MKRALLAAAAAALTASSLFAQPGNISLSFQPNRGQAPQAVRFLARGNGYNLLLTDTGSYLSLGDASVEWSLVGSGAAATISGQEEQSGRVHYMRGGRSIADIPTYGRVKYTNVYPGIDLVYYGRESRLEFDFIVHPGGDPRSIVLKYNHDVLIDGAGNLVVGPALQHKPVLYQGEKEISGSYRLLGTDAAGFEVGEYDRTPASDY